MNPLTLIDKYYPVDNELKHILLVHSQSVADKAVALARKHPELDIDIFETDAEGIQCFGTHPYICHGYLGAELVRKEGFPRHALVCERHTGAGLSLKEIEEQNLPIPHRDMLPISLEEQLICFADKFFSKTKLDKEKSVEKARKSVAKYGEDGAARFDHWCELFL